MLPVCCLETAYPPSIQFDYDIVLRYALRYVSVIIMILNTITNERNDMLLR
jgi:hypothetical protein